MSQTGQTDIDVVSNGTRSPCLGGTILAVAVGGGGTTLDDAGSGSGYVEYTEISVSRGEGQRLRAEVGGAQEATELVDQSTSSSLTILTANPGGNGGGSAGADGYSGGGADTSNSNGGGDGGSGGSNGKVSSTFGAGRGSGFDISIIPLNTIVLR